MTTPNDHVPAVEPASNDGPDGRPADRLDERLGKLINAAHWAALHDDMDRLAHVVGLIGRDFHMQGVGTAMMALVDWYGHESGLRANDAPPDGLVVIDPDAGPDGPMAVDIDTVDAPSRWAVRLIMARLRMDEQQWRALMMASPDDPREFGHYVLTLYRTVGANVRKVREGFNPMPMRPR